MGEQATTSELARALAGMRRRVVKVCPVCGRTFEGLKARTYDTDTCAQRAAYERSADKRRVARRARYQRQKQQGAGEPTP
jgi:hypothetical protein